MKDKHVKSIIIQWIVPFTAFMVVLCVMLINFSITSKKKEYEETEAFLVGTAEDYADEFAHTIKDLVDAAAPIADFAGTYSSQYPEMEQNVAAVLADNTEAYQVVCCNLLGEGVTQDGNAVKLKETDYFIEASGAWQKYVVADDDGITGRSCIIAVVPVKQAQEITGYLLAYYDRANFENMIHKAEFNASGYYAIVDDKGRIICDSGAEHNQLDKTDFWKSILEFGQNTKQLEKAQRRFDNNLSGMIKIENEKGKKDKALIYAPVGVNSWKMIIVMNYSYVEVLVHQEWVNTQSMLFRLLICVLIFIVIIVVFSIIGRVRENEKNRDLTDKADTDLLTGLNNKAATERKIRTYLQENSDGQGLLFIFDIDNFKKINDTMGHAFGDEVLRTLGHQIVAYFRVTDVIGRIGGDEFMIFLKDIKDEESIRKEARKLEQFFRNFQAGEYVKYSATASIGAAVYPQDARDFESLYKMADKALYTSKRRGKNRLTFCSEVNEKKAEV